MENKTSILNTSDSEHTLQERPRIACLVSYWAFTRSHADWIICKLLDGYWWQGAHTPSRVEVVSVYIHQLEESPLGQKVCKAKNIPIFKTPAEAVTLGGTELAVDGVVIIGEHGNYPTDLQGRWLLPRWWIYHQVIQVFQKSKRSVPVFNDKHLSYNWDEARWMFDKQNEHVVVSMLGMPGPFSQYHAANDLPHWITEMMVSKKEPFNAERLLLSTGITNQFNESNWENGRFSAFGRRIETPFLNISYRTTRGPLFNKGERPPDRPYIRGFDQ